MKIVKTSFLITLMVCFAGFATLVAQNTFETVLTLDTIDRGANEACYLVGFKNVSGTTWNLAGQNHRIFYNSADLIYKVGSIMSLLPEPIYTGVNLVQDVSGLDATGFGGALWFEANLGFLNFWIELNNTFSGGLFVEPDSIINVVRLCFDIISEDEEQECFGIIPAHRDVTMAYANAFMEVAIWQAPNTLVPGLQVLPDYSISGPEILCEGKDVLLSFPVGRYFEWSMDGGNESEAIYQNLTPRQYLFQLTVTDAIRCTQEYDYELEIAPLPVLTIDSVVCEDNRASFDVYFSYDFGEIELIFPLDGILGNGVITQVDTSTQAVILRSSNPALPDCFQEIQIEEKCDCPHIQGPAIESVIFCNNETAPPLETVGLNGFQTIWYGDSLAQQLLLEGVETFLPDPILDSVQIFYLRYFNPISNCYSEITEASYAVLMSPEVAISGNTQVCLQDTMILSAVGEGIFQWSFGAFDTQNIEIIGLEEDSWIFLTVTGDNLCVSMDSVLVLVNPLPLFTVELDCEDGVESGSILITPVESTGSEVLYFLNGDLVEDLLLSELMNGIYEIQALDLITGCSFLVLDTLKCNCGEIVLAGQNIICQNSNSSISVSSETMDGIWIVSPVDAGSVNEEGVFSASENFVGGLSIFFQSGSCISDPFSITVVPSLNLDILVLPLSCFGSEDAQISIENITGGIGPYDLFVNGEPFFGVADNLATGPIEISISDQLCQLDTTVFIEEAIDWSDFNILLDKENFAPLEPVLLWVELNISLDSIVSIDWYENEVLLCQNCETLNFTPSQSTEIQVIIEDVFGCVHIRTIFIALGEIEPIIMPNVFLTSAPFPNNLFFVQSPDNQIEAILEISIYDRWGSQVFTKQNIPPNDPSQAWDGRFQDGGKLVAQGVYVYILSLLMIDGSQRDYLGNVTLLH
jgi:hypothetical protein